MHGVIGSAAEAETGVVYGNAQEAIDCHISLGTLGHPLKPTIQPPIVLFMQISSNSVPKLGICAGTGSVIRPCTTTFISIKTKVRTIAVTTLLNIILRCTTFVNLHNTV
jgi:hypothetical protein